VRRAVAALALCALATVAGRTAADASVWQMAAEPERKSLEDALAQADQMLGEYDTLRDMGPPSVRALLLQQARTMLEALPADAFRDPRAQARLAEVYDGLYETDPDPAHLEHAVACRLRVVDSDAAVMVKINALSDLGVDYARLGKHEIEVEAYDRALALEGHAEPAYGESVTNPVRHVPLAPGRALLLANQAEAYMAMGQLRSAIRGYKASLRDLPTFWVKERAPSTMWGLAVALDRYGDFEQALGYIAQARFYDPPDSAIQSSNWFFVPEYDEHWYAALGHWQRARATHDPAARLEALRDSAASWRAYIDRAPADDRWLALAERRLAAVNRTLQKQPAAEHAAPRPGEPKGAPDFDQ
jgi:tetratricopeptide (TPR) repeat protein